MLFSQWIKKIFSLLFLGALQLKFTYCICHCQHCIYYSECDFAHLPFAYISSIAQTHFFFIVCIHKQMYNSVVTSVLWIFQLNNNIRIKWKNGRISYPLIVSGSHEKYLFSLCIIIMKVIESNSSDRLRWF